MFSAIEERELPPNALLRQLADAGHYTDCFVTEIPFRVELETYLVAIYTSLVFKAERFILKWLASLPSTDDEVWQLAKGARASFAAWNLTSRLDNQILLTDVRGRTCSWLMVDPEGHKTRLYFGSAVMQSTKSSKTEPIKMTRWLTAFHRLYSKILLSATRRRIVRLKPRSNH